MAIYILESLPKVDGNPYLFPGKVPGNLIQNQIKAFKRIIKRAEIWGCVQVAWYKAYCGKSDYQEWGVWYAGAIGVDYGL